MARAIWQPVVWGARGPEFRSRRSDQIFLVGHQLSVPPFVPTLMRTPSDPVKGHVKDYSYANWCPRCILVKGSSEGDQGDDVLLCL